MKKINIVLFGVGNVGSTLITQVLELKKKLEKTGELEINLPVIMNSTTAFFEKKKVWEFPGNQILKILVCLTNFRIL